MKSYTATHAALSYDDYGAVYTSERTTFRVWSPKAKRLRVAIYEEWDDFYRSEYDLAPVGDGTWFLSLNGDFNRRYYTYLLNADEDEHTLELIDPWGRASAPNALKSMIVNMRETDPPEFIGHQQPKTVSVGERIIYELHIRDFTIHESSGVTSQNRGKYLGLAELGTTYDGFSTGLSHLKELGVTHVHLMPVSDYKTVDELNPKDYNWGYDPVQFNVPEGSYASSATGIARIVELKKLIQACHENDLSVVLDVVYNHTFYSAESNFNRLAPHYFYRMRGSELSNGSGCGNEIILS